MQTTSLQRALELAHHSGDTAIIVDAASDKVFVLMDGDRYEALLNGAQKPQNIVKKDVVSAMVPLVEEEPVVEPVAEVQVAEDPMADYVLDDILDTEAATTSRVFAEPVETVAVENAEEAGVEEESEFEDIVDTNPPVGIRTVLAASNIPPVAISEPIFLTPEPTYQTVGETDSPALSVTETAQEMQQVSQNMAFATTEVSLNDVPNEREEEKFYLEPVE